MSERAKVVVVTGLSGAGKSTALRALEDLGYFCVDNLPTPLVEHALEACDRGEITRVALGIDVRASAFLEGAAQALKRLIERDDRDVVVLFVDASDVALMQRFNETRRPHPLSASLGALAPGAVLSAEQTRPGVASAVLEGILLERERLAPLRALATLCIDSTESSVHDLRRRVVDAVGSASGLTPHMQIRFVSFGFKYGPPIDADVLLDVRFLQNPYFVPELRPLAGTDPSVRAYVLGNEATRGFVERAEELLRFCLPRYQEEGKSYLMVGIGCTGGRHRSVVLANLLAEDLSRQTGLAITVVHRDVARADKIDRGTSAGAPPTTSGEP